MYLHIKSTSLKHSYTNAVHVCVFVLISVEPSDALASVVIDRHTDTREFGQQTTVTLAAHAHRGLINTCIRSSIAACIYTYIYMYFPFVQCRKEYTTVSKSCSEQMGGERQHSAFV